MMSCAQKRVSGLLDAGPFCDGDAALGETLVTLRNANGLVAQLTNYGARWVAMFVPDRHGQLADVLLGFDRLSQYRTAREQYYGAVVGRVCGRISQARFMLDGKTYSLAANDAYGSPGPNHLHGGVQGFHVRMWDYRTFRDACGQPGVEFSLSSPDGDEGYPGRLDLTARYVLTDYDALVFTCTARSDKATPVNVTNHAYFNLSGGRNMQILSHKLALRASRYLPCDSDLIPTGDFVPVAGRAFDFRTPRPVSDSLAAWSAECPDQPGFSVPFVIDEQADRSQWVVRLEDDTSGRSLEIYTNQPSVQVYTGFLMDGSDIGKYGIRYDMAAGIALEPQGFPDAPNHPEFPPIVLDPGKVYHHFSAYKFSAF